MNKLRLTSIEVEQDLAEIIQACGKDAPRFAPMVFKWEGSLFHEPFADSMRPAERQG